MEGHHRLSPGLGSEVFVFELHVTYQDMHLDCSRYVCGIACGVVVGNLDSKLDDNASLGHNTTNIDDWKSG